MRTINIVAKFMIKYSGSFLVDKGDITIFGADDATAAILQTEFPELQLSSPPSSSASSSTISNSILSTTTSQNGNEPMELNEAFAKITSYLTLLDQQEFTVVSAFNDELFDGDNKYKMYMWTMQK